MRFPATFISACILLQLPLSAENSADEASTDPIANAIESFNNRDLAEPDEAVAVFNQQPEEPAKPVLVTGKPPKDSELVDISEIPVVPEAAELLPPSQPEAKGLEVRIEHLSAGSGELHPENVRLLAPFPAKPLDEAPQGWLLKTSNDAPAFKRQVELAPGKAITLTVRPHLLVPDADQARILEVSEPGFDASLGYEQSDTVSAVLSDSIRSLDEDSKRIGNVIDQLQQLIVSLPKGEPSPIPSEPDGASSIPDARNPIPEKP